MKRKFVFHLLILLLVGSLLLIGQAATVQTASAQAGSADDLISAVNALRAQNGLPPLLIDGALMGAAQTHSEYQAALATATHAGPGGSQARDRAVAAGFGGGAAVSVAENIASGSALSVSQTITSIWADSLHQSTMLNPQHTHVGAGVAEANGITYYTLDVGSIAGGSSAAAASPAAASLPPGSADSSVASTTSTNPPDASPQTATPQPDGSIVHEVKPGEALWSIAILYGVTIDEINRLNGLPPEAIIYAGRKLVVVPAYTPTTSPTVTATLPPPTRTPLPSRTPRPATLTATIAPTATLTSQPLLPPVPDLQGETRRMVGIGMIVLCALGILIVLINARVTRS